MDEPVGALRYTGRNPRYFGGDAARQLAEEAGWFYRRGLVFLDYLDETDHHWTLVIDGEAYRAQVGSFIDVEGEIYLEWPGAFDWKPEEIIGMIPRWEEDGKDEDSGSS